MDVVDLRRFYRSVAGEVVRRLAGAQIRRFWPSVEACDVALVGYGTPYARMLTDARSVAAFMPGPQGVMRWPQGAPNAAVLVEEGRLPVTEGAFDRVLLVHAIETSESLGPFLDEIWRILKPGGQMLAIVPNRRGRWAAAEDQPFGTGRPFTRSQLARLLASHRFVVDGWTHALMMPPSASRLILRTGFVWEAVGRRLWPGFSGLVVMAATKEVIAIGGRRQEARFFRPVPDFVPAPSPARAPLACQAPEGETGAALAQS